MAIPGICGPANRPCKIAHSSSYPNQVGIYPSEFLPSTFTIWHAVFASQFALSKALVETGNFPPIGTGTIPIEAIAPTLPVTHNFQSHHYIIFARTSNRINTTYTLTAQDIANVDALGTVVIDVGEYVFEALAVTTIPIVIDTELTDQEVDGLDENPECAVGCSKESESDREFRKLFEQDIPDNRLITVVPNKEGIEYRLDNGTSKSNQGLNQSGIGDLNAASYRDASSKKIQIQLFIPPTSTSDGKMVEGDVLYLSYVAVKEHYLRQRVNISWQVFDPGTADGLAAPCISLPLGFSVVHYRFYEWNLESEDGGTPPRLAGWRAVESFSSDINFVAPILQNNVVQIADFVMGGPETLGGQQFDILPGLVTEAELKAFQLTRSSLPKINITLDQVTNSGSYHANAGSNGEVGAHINAPWFLRNEFSKYTNGTDASQHVFFNVHPSALRKRDIDKFGIERFLAVELEKDIQAGRPTFFPFMDDPTIDNPTLGCTEYLSTSNTIFQPIKPVTSYGGNFEAVCGSVGSFPTNPSEGINTYHSFESNRINEKFDKDTRVLVERNFAVNAGILGPRLVTIEGKGGGLRKSITALADPSQEMQFASHINDDNFIVYNSFSSGHTSRAIRDLVYRPDLTPPPLKNNSSPTVDQFEDLLGFSGMIGDIPGIQPGRSIAIASSVEPTNFIYLSSDPESFASQNPHIEDDQIQLIEIPAIGTSFEVFVPNSYYGSLKIRYHLEDAAKSKDERAILLLKTGDVIEGLIDGIVIRESFNGDSINLQIDFRWMRSSSFVLVGERVSHMQIESILIRSIDPEKIIDVIEGANSHSLAFAQQELDKRLTNGGIFFVTDVVTLSEDQHSNLYVFFNDKDGGISAVYSNDFGGSWYYYYGIVEQIGEFEARNPFVVTNFEANNCYLFFQMDSKILCKKIPFEFFSFIDSNLIERFSQDVVTQKKSIYSEKGQLLRYALTSHIAAGDLSGGTFIELLNRDDPFEIREINSISQTVLKNPLNIGSTTAFTNRNVEDFFFSAYRRDNGQLRLWFLSPTLANESGGQLQCHFSVDDGINWYDLLEYTEFKYNRLRYDETKKTQFIDRSAPNRIPTTTKGTDPLSSNQLAVFGLNVHWSRLKRHKIGEGELDINSESEVLEIESPYVFYQPTTDRVFIFYIYQECLLCKMFNDAIFPANSVEEIKKLIERDTKSHFIDGFLNQEVLTEEIHGFPNDSTEEIMSEGNIIFKYPFAITNFNDTRSISSQRVCAASLPTGLLRVFYKHADSVNLKSALWTGSEWWCDDFLRTPAQQPANIPDTTDYQRITGGFGGLSF
jgi:hypothetical protein